MKFCTHCGGQIEDDAKFCPKCGSRQDETIEAEVVDDNRNTSFQDNISQDLKNATKFTGENVSPCSRLVAALLAFFLGGLGIHRFYVGRTTSAVFMLIFFWTFIPSVIALIDFVLILCGTFKDGKGREIKAI
jgi:hypothetical protein